MADYEVVKFIKNGVEYYVPKEKKKYIDYLAVGGGGAGGQGGGGGGGGVIFGECLEVGSSTKIEVGGGGKGVRNCYGCAGGWGCDGEDTILGDIVAKGGLGGGLDGGGISGNGYVGGGTTNYYCGGGGGASGCGCLYCDSNYGGDGGNGLCGYGGGGGGAGYRGPGYGKDGGGNGGYCASCGGKNATKCGGGGGGYRAAACGIGCGANGIVCICYPKDGSYGFTCATGGDCCFEEGSNCVHVFTTSGSFDIPSGGEQSFEYLVVGGGGAGYLGGGGGGGVGYGKIKSYLDSYDVSVGIEGRNCCPVCCKGNYPNGGGSSIKGVVDVYGGKAAMSYRGGTSGSGRAGGYNSGGANAAGGGGGAGGNGGDCVSTYCGGAGGLGVCGFGGGGGGYGWSCSGIGCDGGGNGAPGCSSSGYQAWNYGGGGGGAGCCLWSRGCAGHGCQGVAIICYPKDGSWGIVDGDGGVKGESGDYCVHTFVNDGDTFEPKSIKLNTYKIAFSTIGETYQLTAEGSVSWISSDTNVATVDNNGLVTCVSLGDCVITAKSGKKIATCKVMEKVAVGAGIYHNTQLGLLSISSNGTNWITIMDKNNGANEYMRGCYYQWGNNYGWSFDEAYSGVTLTSGQGDVTGCLPGTYCCNVFYCCACWMSTDNPDLWGGVTGTYLAMQGPCPDGFHIPTSTELSNLITTMTALGGNKNWAINFADYLNFPMDSTLSYSNGKNCSSLGLGGNVWSSTLKTECCGRGCYLGMNRSGWGCLTPSASSVSVGTGTQIRPFYNCVVVPDNTWTKVCVGGVA